MLNKRALVCPQTYLLIWGFVCLQGRGLQRLESCVHGAQISCRASSPTLTDGDPEHLPTLMLGMAVPQTCTPLWDASDQGAPWQCVHTLNTVCQKKGHNCYKPRSAFIGSQTPLKPHIQDKMLAFCLASSLPCDCTLGIHVPHLETGEENPGIPNLSTHSGHLCSSSRALHGMYMPTQPRD